jgi:hypothetical protein
LLRLSNEEGGCHIKTLPGWVFGAIAALSISVAIVAVLARWASWDRARTTESIGSPASPQGEYVAPAGPLPSQLEPSPEVDAAAQPPLRQAAAPNVAPEADLDAAPNAAVPDASAVPPAAPTAAPVESSAPPEVIAAEAGVVVVVPNPPGPRVPCGPVSCPSDQECCNPSCGVCTPPGGACTKVFCGAPSSPVSTPCGINTCNVGEVCCNPSCGICTPPGADCSKTFCSDGIYFPWAAPCGLNTCNTGQVCCNPSCGICAAPGEPCSLEPCE